MVVAKYAGQAELLERVEAAVRTQQDSDVAVAFGQGAARILEKVVLVSGDTAGGVETGGWGRVVRCQLPLLGGHVSEPSALGAGGHAVCRTGC